MKPLLSIAVLALLGACGSSFTAVETETLRVATFNASLYRAERGQLTDELRSGSDQARQVATIIQTVRPDVLVLQEFDWDPSGDALRIFHDDYLAAPQSDRDAIEYPHRFTAPVNTGEPSQLDLDGNGTVGGPADCWGYGKHHGQYGMAVLSRFPIDSTRTFQLLRWSQMPGHSIPTEALSEAAVDGMRLSSKSHWDVAVDTPHGTLHVLASHPTPPVFDGPEDRNGRRNHDEIRLWAQYITPAQAGWIRDDNGVAGGLDEAAHFVICGDQNADPKDGDSFQSAITQLIEHPRVDDSKTPLSQGAVQDALVDGGANARQKGASRFDTGDFGDDPGPGNLRLDYALPSRSLLVVDSGVFWPMQNEPYADLVTCSDHRLVWIDVALPR